MEFSAFTTSFSDTPFFSMTSPPLSDWTSMVVFAVCTVSPPDRALGWLTAVSVLMITVRLPWEMAQSFSVTAWFITTEPVRALIMTRARPCAGLTCKFSIRDRKATRALPSGARTLIMRPSSAEAISLFGDSSRLIASTSRVAVVKSVVFNSRLI